MCVNGKMEAGVYRGGSGLITIGSSDQAVLFGEILL